MSDTYTVSPQPVYPGASSTVTVSYKSANFSNGTSYALKSLTGTTLATQTANLKNFYSIPQTGTYGYTCAVDNSGTIFVTGYSGAYRQIYLYSSSGTFQSSIAYPSGETYFSVATKDSPTNTIYWGGVNTISVFNCNTRTFTNKFVLNLTFWTALSYSPSDGFLYGTLYGNNNYTIYKVNSTTGSYNTISTATYGDASYFSGCAVTPSGYVYCVKDVNGTVYKYTTSGTFINSFTTSFGATGTLAYNSASDNIFAIARNGVFTINLTNNSVTSFISDFYGLYTPSFFDQYGMGFYTLNAGNNSLNTYVSSISLTYSFSDSLLTLADYTAQLYNGATPIGIPITLNISCFLQGTRILRLRAGKEEYVAVESLKKGDLIKTSKSGYKPITTIGRKEIYNSPKSDIKTRLYRYRASVCPELSEDLVVTGEHCALVNVVSDEKLREVAEYMGDIYVSEGDYRVPAHLDDRAEPYEKEGTMIVWHFSLENENLNENYGVFANGLLVESSSEQYLTELSGMKMIE
jgi:hypothetical protein